jgi:hypothetical protein
MKRNPAQIRAESPTTSARVPQMPGRFRNRKAAKWMTIISHPVSQIAETGVGLRRETDAKAQASRVTAIRSGISLQFNRHTSKQEAYTIRIGFIRPNSIALL